MGEKSVVVKGPNKSLGQHWLRDRGVLSSIADCAELTSDDVVLEIGPGLGTLTSELLRRSKKVVAVEFDSDLARKLPNQFPGKNLEVVNEDILSFNLETLPSGYKVVANVPYYITSKIVKMLMTSNNKPSITVLLVQKEVAERLAAKPGDMSILAISAQVFAEVTLGDVVPAALFTPPPKVDSQVVILYTRQAPIINNSQEKQFFKLVKAGFSSPRKKLVSNISNGFNIDKNAVIDKIHSLGKADNIRPQDLSVENWLSLLRLLFQA